MGKPRMLLTAAVVAGCTFTPTTPDRDAANPPSARYDGGGFLGGSGNRVGDPTTAAAPTTVGAADSIQLDAAAPGGFLGGSGN